MIYLIFFIFYTTMYKLDIETEVTTFYFNFGLLLKWDKWESCVKHRTNHDRDRRPGYWIYPELLIISIWKCLKRREIFFKHDVFSDCVSEFPWEQKFVEILSGAKSLHFYKEELNGCS